MAALAVLGCAALSATPALAGCKTHAHTASATSYIKSVAGIEARADWRYKVTIHDDITYALWSLAKNRGTKCHKRADSKWVCVARGTPCN
jgi:hypothetical protein